MNDIMEIYNQIEKNFIPSPILISQLNKIRGRSYVIEKEIIGWESEYIVDTDGNVYSTNYRRTGKQKRLKLSNRGGYARVSLGTKRKTYSVHRLVAEAFLNQDEGKDEINHINGDKSDNRIENLEWVTRSENVQHAYDILGVVNGMKGKRKINGLFIQQF